MTRTDVMASSRPHTAAAASIRTQSAGVTRRLAAVSAMLLLALALTVPASALAAEPAAPTSGYNQKPTPTTPTPKTGTSPSKESKTPTTSTTAPANTSTTPATETKASTLPFTGFDLRWSLAVGVLLMGAGFSIVVVQRRQRRHSR
jgi:uncharacterized membrane protein